MGEGDESCGLPPISSFASLSYYKIEFLPGPAADAARLTSGNTSPHLATGREERIRVADPRASFWAPPLLRAAPVAEDDGPSDATSPGKAARIPCASPTDSNLDLMSHGHQKWVVSDSGKIFILPPSSSHVARRLCQKTACLANEEETTKEFSAPLTPARSRGKLCATLLSPSCVSMTRS